MENGGIPAGERWLYELIKINLAEDIHERYHSARELKADLEKRQVTRERTCRKCGQVNKVREPYCGKCAEALTDPTPPCHHCGKVNRMGGAIALGHPLGATGAIRSATVVHALRRHNLKYGMVTMCVGTGMGAAGIFERV